VNVVVVTSDNRTAGGDVINNSTSSNEANQVYSSPVGCG
jgi:hypothetical protein